MEHAKNLQVTGRACSHLAYIFTFDMPSQDAAAYEAMLSQTEIENHRARMESEMTLVRQERLEEVSAVGVLRVLDCFSYQFSV